MTAIARAEALRYLAVNRSAVAGRGAASDPAGRPPGQLEEALASRPVVMQAERVIMGRYRVSATAAHRMLRDLTRRKGRRLAQVADEVVTSATNLPTPGAAVPLEGEAACRQAGHDSPGSLSVGDGLDGLEQFGEPVVDTAAQHVEVGGVVVAAGPGRRAAPARDQHHRRWDSADTWLPTVGPVRRLLPQFSGPGGAT